MTDTMVLSVLKEGVETALLVAAPMLLTATVVGLIVSIFQATTQIQEQTLTFVPKILAAALIGILLGSWMMHTVDDFTIKIFNMIANMGQ